MENKSTKEALKKLRDAFEADYAILFYRRIGFTKFLHRRMITNKNLPKCTKF